MTGRYILKTFQKLSSPQTMKKDICRPGLSPDRRWRGWKRVRDGLSTSPWWRVPRTLSAGWNAGCREKEEELACDRDIATHPQEHQLITTTDDKADFIILLVSMTVP